MKELYIADLKTGEDVILYLMVKNIEIKVGSNHKEYLDLLLGDKTGEINGKKWDIAEEEKAGLRTIENYSVIKVRALVTEWNGMRQLRISRIRKTGAEDNIDMSDFINAAPEKAEDMYGYIMGKAEGFADADLVTCLAAGSMLELLTSAVPLPGGEGGAEVGFATLFRPIFGTTITAAYVVWRFIEYILPIAAAVPLLGLRSRGGRNVYQHIAYIRNGIGRFVGGLPGMKRLKGRGHIKVTPAKK